MPLVPPPGGVSGATGVALEPLFTGRSDMSSAATCPRPQGLIRTPPKHFTTRSFGSSSSVSKRSSCGGVWEAREERARNVEIEKQGAAEAWADESCPKRGATTLLSGGVGVRSVPHLVFAKVEPLLPRRRLPAETLLLRLRDVFPQELWGGGGGIDSCVRGWHCCITELSRIKGPLGGLDGSTRGMRLGARTDELFI